MGMPDTPKEPPVSLHLRVTPELKRQVEEYAARVGLTTNAAAVVLLSEALRMERRRRTR